MTHNSQTIIDESGIELVVGYDFEQSDDYYAEEGNPGTYVAGMVYTELTSVAIFIKGWVVTDILPLLTDKQKEYIISLLNYE